MKNVYKLTVVGTLLFSSTVALAQGADLGNVETSNGVKITEIAKPIMDEVDELSLEEVRTLESESTTGEVETTVADELDEPIEETTTVGDELDNPVEASEESTTESTTEEEVESTTEEVDPDIQKLYEDAKAKVEKDLEGVDYEVDVTEDLSKNLLDIINRIKEEGYFEKSNEVLVGKTPIEKDNTFISESVLIKRVPKEVKLLSGTSVEDTVLVSAGKDGYVIEYKNSKISLDGADLVVKHDGESLSSEYNASNQMVPEVRAKAEVQGDYKVNKILVVKEAPKSQEDLEKLLNDKGIEYGEVAQIQKLYLDEEGNLVNDYITVRMNKDGKIDTVLEKGGLNYVGEEKEVDKENEKEEDNKDVKEDKEQDAQVVEVKAAKGQSIIQTGDQTNIIIGVAGAAIVLGLIGLFVKKKKDNK